MYPDQAQIVPKHQYPTQRDLFLQKTKRQGAQSEFLQTIANDSASVILKEKKGRSVFQ